MISQAYKLRILSSYIHTYIHIVYSCTYTYTLIVLLYKKTMKKIAQLFTDGYKITAQGVV